MIFRGKKIKFWMESMNKYEKTFDLQFLIPPPRSFKKYTPEIALYEILNFHLFY